MPTIEEGLLYPIIVGSLNRGAYATTINPVSATVTEVELLVGQRVTKVEARTYCKNHVVIHTEPYGLLGPQD